MSLNLDPAALERARRFSVYGLLLLTAVLFVQWIPGSGAGIPRDFGQYLTAAEIVKARDADALYFVDAMTGITTPEFPGSAYQGYVEKAGLEHASYYIYAPWVGVLYIPFTFVSPQIAFLAMYALNWLFTVVAFFLLARILPRAGALAASLAFLLLVHSYPFRHALEAGQLSLAIFLLFVLMAHAHLRNRDVETGVWWALATGLKLFPVLFLPYFLITRRWKALAAFAGVGVVLLGVSVAVSDVAAIGRFLDLTREYGNYTTTRATNFSLVALLVRLTEGGSLDLWTVQTIPPTIALVQKAVAGGLLLAVLASVWRAVRAGGFWALPLSFALMTTWVLTSPANVWSHQMTALALPLAVAGAVGIAANGMSGLWPFLWGGAWAGLLAFDLYIRAGGGDGAGPVIYAAVVAPFAGILLLYILLFWMCWSVPKRTAAP